MPAQPLAQADRRFEVDFGTLREAAQRRDVEGLDRHVRVEAVVVQRNRRQADAVHGDALAEFELVPRQAVRPDGQAHVAAAFFHCTDRAFCLDDSRKHQPASLAVMRVSSPMRRTSLIDSVLRSASACQAGVANMPRVSEPIMWGDW